MTRTSRPGENQDRESFSRALRVEIDRIEALPWEPGPKGAEKRREARLKASLLKLIEREEESKNTGESSREADSGPVPGRADPGTALIGRLIVTGLLAGFSGLVWMVFGGGAGLAVLAAGILALGFVFLRGGNKQND